MTNAMRRELFKRRYHNYRKHQHRTARMQKLLQRVSNDPEAPKLDISQAQKNLWEAQGALIKAKYQFIRIGNVKGFRSNLFLRLRRDTRLLENHTSQFDHYCRGL